MHAKKISNFPRLTSDCTKADDVSAGQREGSIGWESNSNILRLFTWRQDCLHSSGSLLMLPETHSPQLRKRKRIYLVLKATNCTTSSSTMSQVTTDLDWSGLIKHIRNISLILGQFGPNALRVRDICWEETPLNHCWDQRKYCAQATLLPNYVKQWHMLKEEELTKVGIILKIVLLLPVPWLGSAICNNEVIRDL